MKFFNKSGVPSTSAALADGGASYGAQPSTNNISQSYMVLDLDKGTVADSNAQILHEASVDEILREYLATPVTANSVAEDPVYQQTFLDLLA